MNDRTVLVAMYTKRPHPHAEPLPKQKNLYVNLVYQLNFVTVILFEEFIILLEMLSSNTKPIKPIKINLNIGDQLTSISCGHVVVELIKFIAYQRLQIPYSYQWLKQVVNKRKACEEENRNENLQSERHFRIASTSLENLDFILKVRRKKFISFSHARGTKFMQTISASLVQT